VTLKKNNAKLSTVCKEYKPSGTSTKVYEWIDDNLAKAVEEAINIRNEY